MKSRLIALTLLLAATACAGTQHRLDVVWPPPPEVARIKFVDSWASIEDVDKSGWGTFKRTLLGTRGETRFIQPMGIVVSADGNLLYVADYQGVQIVRVDVAAHTMTRFAPSVALGTPFGVALDAGQNLYVSDTGQRSILVLDPSGRLLRTIGLGELQHPTGLAVDQKRQLLYVADQGGVTSQKHRVLVFSLTGQKLRQVGGDRGTAPGQFNFPSYLALDAAGNVTVADSMNFRVQQFSADGELLRAFGEVGDSQGTFARMKGMGFDGFGNLYVVDAAHAAVQIFNKEMQLLMWFGGRVGAVEYLELPSCLAVDPRRNRIYVCEQGALPRVNVYDLVNTSEKDSLPSEPPATQSPAQARPAGTP